jgi:hypothetical protein
VFSDLVAGETLYNAAIDNKIITEVVGALQMVICDVLAYVVLFDLQIIRGAT